MFHDRLEKPKMSFTHVPNALICSTDLSCKAKAVYCYLISRPDDWKFYTNEIVKNMKEAKKTVDGALRELITYRWIEKKQIRVKGKFSHSVYSLFYDVSSVSPITANDKTANDKTANDKTANHFLPTTNTDSTNTDSTNTELKSAYNRANNDDYSVSKFRRDFIKDKKGHILTIENCEMFASAVDVQIDKKGYLLDYSTNKYYNKKESFVIWTHIYNSNKGLNNVSS